MSHGAWPRSKTNRKLTLGGKATWANLVSSLVFGKDRSDGNAGKKCRKDSRRQRNNEAALTTVQMHMRRSQKGRRENAFEKNAK